MEYNAQVGMRQTPESAAGYRSAPGSRNRRRTHGGHAPATRADHSFFVITGLDPVIQVSLYGRNALGLPGQARQ
jgi:hypothetical protein